jgi:hypothetical protein
MLAYFKGSEVHNELLHDESIVFASRIFYPESDHAPVIARFEMPETKIKWPTDAEEGEQGASSAGGVGKGYQCIKSGKGRCR